MSIVVVATIHPKPEHRDAVVDAFVDTVARVHAEDEGCELYALHEGRDRLVMVEKWASPEALAAHGRSAALSELNTRVAGLLESAPDVQILQPRAAGTDHQGLV
jgi:quinol monooxygenase YgiN